MVTAEEMTARRAAWLRRVGGRAGRVLAWLVWLALSALCMFNSLLMMGVSMSQEFLMQVICGAILGFPIGLLIAFAINWLRENAADF